MVRLIREITILLAKEIVIVDPIGSWKVKPFKKRAFAIKGVGSNWISGLVILLVMIKGMRKYTSGEGS
jgi:hypothetical protein